MIYLAIGFQQEQALTWSIEVITDLPQPQRVAGFLAKSSGGTWPDQILLVRNGELSPNVIEHWNIDKDYSSETFKVGDTVIVTTDRLENLRVPLGQGAKATIEDANPDDDEYTIGFQNFPDADGSADERRYFLHAVDMKHTTQE